MTFLTVIWLQIRRSWRVVATVLIGALGVMYAYARYRAKGRDDADKAADDRVVELAEDVVIANARAVQEIEAVKAKDIERRAEVIAAATDPDRAQRLARLARLMRWPP